MTPANNYDARCYCRLGRGHGLSNVRLNSHEKSLLCCIADPIDIAGAVEDIAGCSEFKQHLLEIIRPVQLCSRPRGSSIMSILMVGGPGYGKTMLATVRLWSCTVPFVIAGGPLNTYIVVYMHVVYT